MTTELYVSYQAVAKHNVSASLFPSSLSLSLISCQSSRARRRRRHTQPPYPHPFPITSVLSTELLACSLLISILLVGVEREPFSPLYSSTRSSAWDSLSARPFL